MDDDSGNSISVHDETGVAGHDQVVCEAVGAALRRFQIAGAEVGVALVNDARIAQLNEHYLGHPGPTDVITFDLREGGGPAGGVVEGEIVISVETAAREAAARGHAVEREIALYAVHGVLHLLGWNDADELEAEKMHAMEDEVLSGLGWERVFAAPLRKE